jgi:hypothetical protein
MLPIPNWAAIVLAFAIPLLFGSIMLWIAFRPRVQPTSPSKAQKCEYCNKPSVRLSLCTDHYETTMGVPYGYLRINHDRL